MDLLKAYSIIFVFVIMASSCEDEQNDEYVFEGIVTEYTTGDPMANMELGLTFPFELLVDTGLVQGPRILPDPIETVSDFNGFFRITIDATNETKYNYVALSSDYLLCNNLFDSKEVDHSGKNMYNELVAVNRADLELEIQYNSNTQDTVYIKTIGIKENANNGDLACAFTLPSLSILPQDGEEFNYLRYFSFDHHEECKIIWGQAQRLNSDIEYTPWDSITIDLIKHETVQTIIEI